MEILQDILLGIIVLTSVLAVVLVLLNKGKGGGLSDMFGGGMTQSLNTSGVAQKNLVRLTTTVIIVWAVCIAAYGISMRFVETAAPTAGL
ncbi:MULTISPECIES: preprotein translocase subunit SecG [Kocuria]|jgi:preprotein translocase subunit SecG|uniref:Protein-export membrane protein SecG n=1 Tax=Kocuria palustris PEL TaxID=1236550 RepID=M2WGZ1_9MICC|nr:MULTISPECIES: preprotein translocase subunit SecG [Kocuria]MDN5701560.1 preprotein translocase subunit SecG [Micrococcales bacterium]ALB03175.1 preprotein translocase subunit SecG [Kocuria palustris]EME37842.1 Preprotein translocase subunit SecG [Kocuria palustris PEL]MBN6752531.1 preprotein translocase subunit SecG [Kocuria palustris]MBN6757486.1 preprotein translocase subunit SecG [Kocuria palustris]